MQLIVNADDFGLTPGVNRGIIDCHRAGSVTSATLMVNMPAAEEAAKLAIEHSSLGVGLHFNMTLGHPLSPASVIPSLVDRKGEFHRRPVAEKLAMACRFRPAEIEIELLAQFRRFEALGLTPTHIDSHQHIHLFPAVFDVLAGLCAERDLPLRIPWVARRHPGGLRRHLRGWVLDRLVKRNASRWSGRVGMNAGFGSVFDKVSSPEAITAETYRSILCSTTDSPLELMVHPAWVDDELAARTGITGYSEREREVLCDVRFAEMVATLGWRLTDYRGALS